MTSREMASQEMTWQKMMSWELASRETTSQEIASWGPRGIVRDSPPPSPPFPISLPPSHIIHVFSPPPPLIHVLFYVPSRFYLPFLLTFSMHAPSVAFSLSAYHFLYEFLSFVLLKMIKLNNWVNIVRDRGLESENKTNSRYGTRGVIHWLAKIKASMQEKDNFYLEGMKKIILKTE